MLKRLLKSKSDEVLPRLMGTDAPEEHRISLPGIEVAFNYGTNTVFLVDQSGGANEQTIKDLEDHLRSKGWFLHTLLVTPPEPKPAPREKSA